MNRYKITTSDYAHHTVTASSINGAVRRARFLGIAEKDIVRITLVS